MFKNKMVILGAVFFCLVMVIFPEITASASKDAMHLWVNAVVPTLFPFIIMANFIQRTGVLRRMSMGVYPFVMALFSGYPMGARIAGDAYRNGYIDEKELKQILSYSMITGPAFIVGAVGVGFFHSQILGCVLAFSHYGGALMNGLVSGGFSTSISPKTGHNDDENDMGYASFLTDSILDGFRTIGIILAYIMLFMVLTDLLQFSGLFSLFARDDTAALAKGILEMTVGCNALQNSFCSLLRKMIYTSFVLSFGGLSILGQSMSMLSGCPVTLGQLLVMKLRHGIFSGILTFTICSFVV